MKEKFKHLYMDWAKRCAELSYARRLHVGAVIVKDDTVISYGYNGMPAGWDNDCENLVITQEETSPNVFNMDKKVEYKTKPEVLHAESNAIAKLARSNNSGLGADIFITHAPCLECAKLIYQSGIRRVFYSEEYRDLSGLKFLAKSGVETNKLQNN